MKGYKASYNGFCRDFKFEVGKTYELNDKPICCFRGFHFCPIAKDVLTYYNHKHDFKLFEINALGEIDTQDDKCATNRIHILREITDKDELFQLLGRIYTYDQNGNPLTFKDSSGYWSEYTYNQNGQELTFKDSSGYWREYTRNQNGDILTYENSIGSWVEYSS